MDGREGIRRGRRRGRESWLIDRSLISGAGIVKTSNTRAETTTTAAVMSATVKSATAAEYEGIEHDQNKL